MTRKSNEKIVKMKVTKLNNAQMSRLKMRLKTKVNTKSGRFKKVSGKIIKFGARNLTRYSANQLKKMSDVKDDAQSTDMGQSATKRIHSKNLRVTAFTLNKFHDRYFKSNRPTYEFQRFPTSYSQLNKPLITLQRSIPFQSSQKTYQAKIRYASGIQEHKLTGSNRKGVSSSRFHPSPMKSQRSSRAPRILADRKNPVNNTYISRLKTGRYVGNIHGSPMPRKYSFSRYHQNYARVNMQVTTDSGMEAIRGTRVAYRRTVNTIRTARNTAVATRKTIQTSKRTYTAVKTSVRNARQLNRHRAIRSMRLTNMIATVKRMIVSLKLMVNPASLWVAGVATFAILIIIVINTVAMTVTAAISDTFGWLHRPGKDHHTVFKEYENRLNENIFLVNLRLKGIVEHPEQAPFVYFSFHFGYTPQPPWVGIKAEYVTHYGDDHLNNIPTHDLVTLTMVEMYRKQQSTYTIVDFESTLIQIFSHFFTYNERASTYYHPDHGVDDEGNPIRCEGHPSIIVYVKNHNVEDVMERLNYTDSERALFDEFKLALTKELSQ